MRDVTCLADGDRDPLAIVDKSGIRFIILDRPEARNALTRAMRVNFARLLAEADADPAVSALVLTGAGGTFSAGVDLKDRIAGAPPVEPNPGVALRGLAKPIVAAIDGPCVTGAIEMALSCAFAIATPGARFADTHCKVGLFPRWGGGSLLAGAIGIRRARQMALTGEFIGAATALAWGLVNEIVPAEGLLDRAAELAGAMATQQRAQPLSYRLYSGMLSDIETQATAVGVERDALRHFDEARRGAQ